MRWFRTCLVLTVTVLVIAALSRAGHAQQAPTKIWNLQAPIISLGDCQQTSVSTAQPISAATCASFTGSASGTTLTATNVTGFIAVGQTVTGTGVPSGTTIVSQSSATGGVNGGAGTYVTSQTTTASSASLTTSGIPSAAVFAVVQVESETARWRDDGTAPTASVGQPLTAGQPIYFTSSRLGVQSLSDVQLIPETGSMTTDVSYYGIR